MLALLEVAALLDALFDSIQLVHEKSRSHHASPRTGRAGLWYALEQFVDFIPLAFHPENTYYANLPPTTGLDDLKTIAVSRLMLDNFPHIKAYWVTLTPELAQVALRFGAAHVASS